MWSRKIKKNKTAFLCSYPARAQDVLVTSFFLFFSLPSHPVLCSFLLSFSFLSAHTGITPNSGRRIKQNEMLRWEDVRAKGRGQSR